MLKSISNLGNVLGKQEQQKINGGSNQCPPGTIRDCWYINGGSTYVCTCIYVAVSERPATM